MNYVIAILIGILIGVIIAFVQKSALTSVHMQHAAAEYIKRTPGSFIHGIFQVRIPEWVAISFSRISSRPRE